MCNLKDCALWKLEGTDKQLVFLAQVRDSCFVSEQSVLLRSYFSTNPEGLNSKPRYLTRLLLCGAHIYATGDLTVCS